MSTPSHLAIALGGILLVAWYGLARSRGRIVGPIPGDAGIVRPHGGLIGLRGEFAASRVEDRIAGGEVTCPCCGTPHPAGTPFCDCGNPTVDSDDVPVAQPPLALRGIVGASNTTTDEAEHLPLASIPDGYVCVSLVDTSWKGRLMQDYLAAKGIPCLVWMQVREESERNNNTAPQPIPKTTGVGLFVPDSMADQARALLKQI